MMRQGLIVSPTRFEVVKAAVPALQGDDEILVRTVACGICSGDLMPWYLQKKVGTVLGHEVVGRAVEVGRRVADVRPGDLVFPHHHAPCGECPDCERGAVVHCASWRCSKIDPGGMAEYVRIPATNAQRDTFAVNVVTTEQAVFIEPLACSVKAFRRIPALDHVLPHTHGVVVGCGVMGLLNLMVARAGNVPFLTAVEPDSWRREMALRCGAHHALSPEEAWPNLRESADFVIVGPGHPEVIKQALGYVRPGGTALLFTPTPTGVATPLDLGDLYFREVSLVPSYSCGPEDTKAAYEMLVTGKVRPEILVTHRFPLERLQEAFDTALAGRDALKVLVTFPEPRRGDIT
jgi:L-iditol 2-dehydrogenase